MQLLEIVKTKKTGFIILLVLCFAVLSGISIAVVNDSDLAESFPVLRTARARMLYYYDRLLNSIGLHAATPASRPEMAKFNDPSSIVVGPDGRIYISERRRHVIRVLEKGTLSVIAGNFRSGYTGDGIPAISARLRFPEGLALDAQGNLYVADSGNHRVRRIDRSGIISTFAGTGGGGFSGDGGLAQHALLKGPMDVAVDSMGSVYIADRGNHCIRKVTPDGVIHTVAGNRKAGFSGDRRIATDANLDGPYGVGIDRDGNLYIADSGNHRVRKVSNNGVIDTISGTGSAGYAGDGGPAVNAQLDSPQAVFIDSYGEVYINDEHNHRIRKIDLNGIITTFAGNGRPGLCGDGGMAVSACLYDPEDIWMDSEKNIYLADGDNHRVRKITPDGLIQTIAGSGPSGKKTRDRLR